MKLPWSGPILPEAEPGSRDSALVQSNSGPLSPPKLHPPALEKGKRVALKPTSLPKLVYGAVGTTKSQKL